MADLSPLLCFRPAPAFSASLVLLLGCASSALADQLIVRTGDPDGLMAVASRPPSANKSEIEAADDFLLSSHTQITGGTFVGLLPPNASLSDIVSVDVEIYRVFPSDSNNPPSGTVPTRANSPSDVALATRGSASAGLSFVSAYLNNSFTTLNSVLNGINPFPGQTTGGEGSVTGKEVLFAFSLPTPIDLTPDHYFFVPQVQLSGSGNFYWLSAPKPIVPPGTPFTPDLQAWVRNANLDPNWLRVGTDIVGGVTPPTFNMAFSLDGNVVPEPTAAMLLAGLTLLTSRRRKAE